MNVKKLLALVLAVMMIVCALPVVYAAVSDSATEDDTDITVDVEDLPTVTVIYGDADGDGEITANDAGLVLQSVAGWDVTIDTSAADVDGDSDITANDAGLILQCVAGWDVTLGG